MLGGILFAEFGLAFLMKNATLLEQGIYTATAMIGSLIPDIDHPNSKISKHNNATKLISYGVSSVTRHRGFTHTIPFILVCIVPFILMFQKNVPYTVPAVLGIVTGMLSHLALDSLNPTGIMWAYPVKKRYYHISKIKTCSKKESIFFLLLFLVTSFGIYVLNTMHILRTEEVDLSWIQLL